MIFALRNLLSMATSPSIYVLDSNITIDAINGDIVEALFHLPFEFATTDVLIYELRRYDTQALLNAGLREVSLASAQMRDVLRLGSTHKRLSAADRTAYVLAHWKGYGLLTGDGALRQLATTSGITVHGVLWALDQLVDGTIIEPAHAAKALKNILNHGSRLPQNECAQRLVEWST